MRPSVISRSTKKRLQQLAAFLTAVAIIAGFLPLSAVKVSADVQPTEAYPYLFEIWTDGKGTVDFDKNTYPVYSLEDDDRLITACSATKSFTVTVTPEQDEFLDEVVICIDEYEEHNIHLTQQEKYSDANLGVSYSEGSLTFTILDESSTEYRGILIFFSGRYQEDVIEDDYILNEPQTIEGGHGARIRNCTVTLNADLTIQAGGNLILEGTASINGVGHIKPVPGASLSFEGGASAPEGITLYDTDGTTELTGSFDQWEEFSWDGSKWVKPAPPSSEKRIESDFTVNENTEINGGESWRIVGSKLTIAEGSTLTVNAGGNLILEGEDAQIENFSAVTFVEGASFSFEDGANAPSGITLYDGDGTTKMNGPFDGYEEFRLDNGKWVRNMPPPANETRIESDFTVNENTEINGGESWRIVGSKLTIAEGSTLTVNAGGNLILEGEDAQIENFSAVTFEDGASFSFEGGANAPSGVTLYDGDGITKIEGPFDAWEEFVKDNGKWVRVMQGPGPSNETLINTDTTLEEDKVILAGESWKIDRCVLTLNCKLTIENGGELFLDGSGAAIDVVDNFEPLEGAYLNIGNGADAPANITLYAEDGTTEMNISTYQNWERFRYDGTKWIREVGPSDKYFYDQPATITEDIVVEADESMRVVGCTVTLDSTGSITVKNNGKLILDGSEASITGFVDIDFKDGAILAFQSGANVPAGITLYDEDGTEMTDTSFQQWEQFRWDATAGKWIHDDSQPKASFPGATNFDDTNAANGTIVIEYEHGKVTVVAKDNSTVFSAKKDANGVVVVKCDGSIEITAAPDPDYSSKIKIGDSDVDGNYKFIENLGSGMEIEVTFTGPSFILEVGGNLKEGTTYEVDDTNKKITLTYDHGTVEITNYISLVDVNPVTPGSSSVVISYEFTLEGNKADVKFIPDENYIFNGMHLDGKDVAPDDERIENGVLSLTGIDKNNKVSIEPRFDETPVLKIVKVNAGETIGYDSSTKTLTFSENGINKGTVTITNESDPFSGNPQQDSKITSDITFTITPGTVPESDPEIKYVCFVMLNNGQGIYFPEAGTYTLKASDLRTTPEGNKNELSFEFKTLAADQLAKVKFNGEIKYDSGTHDYYIEYKDGENLIGTVVIPGSAVSNFSANNGETTVTIKQSVASLNLTFAPEAGYTPSLTEYGPEYGENQTVTGEWTRDLSITNNNGEYSYSLTVDPQNSEPIGLRVAFSNTKFLQSTVTYKTYEGEQCAVEIGGTGVPGGDLNNKLVEYQTPLSLTADEDSKEYVKVEGGKEYVRMQFSVPFTYYMSEVKINGKDYSTDLPAGYDELIAAFGNQYTNAVIWVEIADSYVIETKAYKAVFDENHEKTTLAVGNFLWFYDESHKDNDDYVKNAYLEIVQVEYNGEIYSKDNGNVVLGSAISWDVIEKDGEIVGGEATLPAGSYVTMKLIPDYGTQLVSLGLNGGGFTADQNEMYTYSFYVGPGNFHLNADFEPVDDVVEASATAVDGGSIALGDGTVDNGTAVLYVGDANVAGAEKTNFENLAADEALEISSYLDISLDKVVYQGVGTDKVQYDGDGKNVWTSGLNDLAKPATVTLTLTDDIGDGTVKVLHNHNGNLEVIDADYNPATKELTFETSSFSNYAIAVEAEQYKVTFNANGHGTAPAAQTVTSGSKATKPTDPTASGYTFGGWYTDSACTKAYSFDTAVTANVTLYAKWTAAATPTPTPVTTPTATPTPAPVSSAQLLVGGGQAHVQDIGDTPVSVDPNTGILTIGTTGQSKRLEEITINFENTTGYEGTMMYRVHVQDYGWLPWAEAGNPAGTTGECKRIEAIEIKLTGELAKYYSVEYCVHIQDYGDMQGWVKDGALAGTTGESKRIEEIKVRVVPKGTGDTMSVKYRVHIQDIGWESTYATNGAMSGTSGQSKRLEGIEIFLTGTQYSGGIQYKTHIQDIGWESSWAENGEMSGTQGQSKRLEAISIQLTGEVAEYYDIYYRVHAQDIGWLAWAKNGEYAGTAGRSARLEGIQIVLVPKGSPAPGATYQGITAATSAAFVEGF